MMLKKPSGLVPPTAFVAKPAAMEVESTRVQTLPDGKKIIDVTMRRTFQGQEQEKLVVPQFDDESSSSSSDDDDEPGLRPQDQSLLLNKETTDCPEEQNNNDSIAYTAGSRASFQGNFVWSGVQDMQLLTHENASLHGHVDELKSQLKTLQIQLEALAPVPGLNAAALQDILLDKDGTEHDIRDTKIVHQAKTLRHLKRSLQREKQLAVDAVKQCKAMETRLAAVEKENETLTLKLARFQARASAAAVAAHPSPPEEDVGKSDNESTGKEKKESVSVYKKKFEDMRIKHDKLLADLKKTQRALIREVGEDVVLEDVVEASATGSETAKRGRAQQIIMLKAKVRKLEQELSKVNGSDADTTVSDVDQRAQQELAAQQAQKQRVIDKLTAERDDLQDKVHQLTKKFDALKSRAQILEKEKQEHKKKLQVLVDKSRNDDALVDALQKQLEMWKGKLQEAKRARTAESSSVGSGGGGVGLPKDEGLELDRLRVTVAEFRRQHPLNQSNSNGFMPPPSEVTQFRAILAEKERLVEQVKVLQSQLEEKDKQVRAFKSAGAGEIATSHLFASRIPRLGSGSILPASQHVPAPPGDSSSNEALRKSFRDAMAAKEQEIESLKLQIWQATHDKSSDMQQDIQDLQEENDFLRQEFERLKARYEAVIKNARPNKS